MGYTTEFDGQFSITPSMKPEHVKYINQFSETRRMKRDAKIAETFSDPVRIAVGLPIGKFGEYFVGSPENCGQNHDASILSINDPSPTQPGLWCNWSITEDGNYLEWNGSEKFYYYTEWLEYIIKNFLNIWGYTLNGVITYK